MKNLLLLLFLIPAFATAQINGTIQKTVATSIIRGSFGSSGIDTLPPVRLTGIANGMTLIYNSTTKRFHASIISTSSIDTAAIRTVANSVSLAELQTRLNTKVTVSPGSAQTGFINMTGNITSGATIYGSNGVFTNTIENNAAAYATGGYSVLVKNTASNVFQTVPSNTFEAPLIFSSPLVRTTDTISLPLATSSVNGYLSATDRTNFQSAYTYSQVGHLPLTGGTLTGALTGTSATFNATVDDVLTLSNSGNRPRIRYNVASGALGALVGISSGPGIIFTGAGANYYAIRADYGINIGVGDVIAQTITTGGATTFEGAVNLSAAPTTSAGTYDILTRNTSTGVVEKVASSVYATTASPTLTGTPTAPTATANTNNTQIATTAYADAKVQNSLTASTTIAPSATAVNTGLALKADLASPALTGTPTAPTATAGTNTTQLATTAFVQSAVSGTASSGTYTPTVASVTNTSAFTVYNSHYIRVGNEVTVMVQVEANSTTTGAGSFSVSLPVASNMTDFTDLSGTGSTNGSFTIPPVITGDAVSDLAIVEFTKGAVGSNRFFLTFMYTVR